MYYPIQQAHRKNWASSSNLINQGITRLMQ